MQGIISISKTHIRAHKPKWKSKHSLKQTKGQRLWLHEVIITTQNNKLPKWPQIYHKLWSNRGSISLVAVRARTGEAARGEPAADVVHVIYCISSGPRGAAGAPDQVSFTHTNQRCSCGASGRDLRCLRLSPEETIYFNQTKCLKSISLFCFFFLRKLLCFRLFVKKKKKKRHKDQRA